MTETRRRVLGEEHPDTLTCLLTSTSHYHARVLCRRHRMLLFTVYSDCAAIPASFLSPREQGEQNVGRVERGQRSVSEDIGPRAVVYCSDWFRSISVNHFRLLSRLPPHSPCLRQGRCTRRRSCDRSPPDTSGIGIVTSKMELR